MTTQQPTQALSARVDVQTRGDHARPELSLAAAHAALAVSGITISPGRVRKLLKNYRRCNQGQDFGSYVTEEMRRVITYRDQTGEAAVNRVLRGDS